MGHYSGMTPKRHICWANSPKVGGLDRGTLSSTQRREIARSGVKSATTKVNRKGKKQYTGTSSLRGTGWGPELINTGRNPEPMFEVYPSNTI